MEVGLLYIFSTSGVVLSVARVEGKFSCCCNVMFVAQNVMSYIDKTNFLARWGCRLYMYKITGIRYSRQDRLFLATKNNIPAYNSIFGGLAYSCKAAINGRIQHVNSV